MLSVDLQAEKRIAYDAMITLAISAQKGGVSKTTTTLALGALLAAGGRRVLLVDVDPQASLTQALGFDCPGRSLAEVIGGSEPGELSIPEIVRPVKDRLDLAPGDLALSSCELGLIARLGREMVLRHALDQAAGGYDVALLDCPPSLGILTVNALVAARGVIVPTLPAALDLRGLRLFLSTLQKVKPLNKQLEVLGVIVAQYDARLTAHQSALDALQAANLKVLGTIPRSVRVQESGAAGQSITDYDPTGKPAEAYRHFARRVDQWLRKN
jgi:chromosome partitioning protein